MTVGDVVFPNRELRRVPKSGTVLLMDLDPDPDQNQIPPSVPPVSNRSLKPRAAGGVKEGGRVNEHLLEQVHTLLAEIGENGARWTNGLRTKFLPPIVGHEMAPTAEEIIAIVRKRIRQPNVRFANCPPALVLAPDEFGQHLAKLRWARANRLNRKAERENVMGLSARRRYSMQPPVWLQDVVDRAKTLYGNAAPPRLAKPTAGGERPEMNDCADLRPNELATHPRGGPQSQPTGVLNAV
jgi:hypothetical protein